MPVSFTPEQQLAIKTRGRDMLVSAAAGSGKTAVLTERIIQHLMEGTDIDTLLVVTFTEAAAAEMRERIARQIDERLKTDPGNAHLQRQAALLPTAQVSTIHAFCRRLVKEHFARVDLDPAFKVGDETELALIQAKVIEELFEEEYAKPDNDAFLDLSDAFGNRTRDDRLDELVRTMNRFIENCPNPEEAAQQYAAMFAQGAADLDETPWMTVLREELAVGIAGALHGIQSAKKLCLQPDGPDRYLDALHSDEALLHTLADSLTRPFASLYAAFNALDWARLHSYRAKDAVDPVRKEQVKTIRNQDIKDRINKLRSGCFFTKPQKMHADIAALQSRVEALIALALRYRKHYDEEKRLRNLLDFSDLEHYAIRILTEDRPDDPAPRFSFREVLIDEYQDSNAVQELILSTVAGSAPRFMVGDVKQSIYRFRRANPKLFIEKYEHYQRLTPENEDGMCHNHSEGSERSEGSEAYEENEGGEENERNERNERSERSERNEKSIPARVDLSRNFRSRSEVLDTANFFFSQLMSPEVGEVAYDEHAALYPGADYPPPPEGFTYKTRVALIDCATATAADNNDDDAEVKAETDKIETDKVETDKIETNKVETEKIETDKIETDKIETDKIETDKIETDKIELEAGVIAQYVHSLVGRHIIWDDEQKAYRPCRNGDIVILARSVTASAGALTEALKKNDVDAIADISTGFFETIEISTALSFLRVVDNPRQDIDLITVLYSPVYAFTPDELLLIRDVDRDADYFDCVQRFAEVEAAAEAGTKTETDTAAEAAAEAAEVAEAAEAAEAAADKTPRLNKTLTDKVRLFLTHVNKWRAQAAYLPVSRLIGIIYDDTNYPAYAGAMPGGRIRQANLRLLLERAIQYEETSFKGLFHFVRFIAQLNEAGGADSVNAAQTGAEKEDRIRIMSIHKAKGLEFPIVFVSRLGQNMNHDEERRNIVLHQEHGIGPSYIDLETRTKANTLARLGLARLIRRESLSEELRVLYVAMTRAKEMLILTGCISDWEKQRSKWASAAETTEELLPVYRRRECTTYLDWLMPCLARHRDTAEFFADSVLSLPTPTNTSTGTNTNTNTTVYTHPARFALRIHSASTSATTAVETEIETEIEIETPIIATLHTAQRIGCDAPVLLTPQPYPFASARDLPSKVSISELKRLYALETTPDSAPFYDAQAPTYDTPALIRDESGVSAMIRGTVLHTVAEHIDLHEHRTAEAIEALIQRLAAQNLLTPEEAAAVNRGAILRFTNTALADRMRAAKNIRREVPFVMGLSPNEVYPDRVFPVDAAEEIILVHGIIDCYFEENGKIVLLDYKSDAVSGDPQQWAKRHRVQMNIYKKAVTNATARKVSETLLYSFALGEAIAVTDDDNN